MLEAQAPDALDQKAWQGLTSWDGPPPTRGEVWRLLTHAELPGRFREAVAASRHLFVQQLRRSASDGV
jgi:hypothetical protein